jgi:hypothetical protein
MRAMWTALVLVGFGSSSLPAFGQDEHPTAAAPPVAAPIAPLGANPTAGAIIERFIEVTGGRAGWASLRSLRGLGTLEVVGANVGGSLAIFQTRDGFRMSVDAGGSAAQVTIRSGDEAWTVRPDGTVQEMTGGALRKLLRDRPFNPLIEAAALYASMELAGIEEVDGSPAWKIRCVPMDEPGSEEVRFFDVATGLQVKVIEQGAGKAAAFPTEIYLSNYTQVGPVKVAFKTRIGVARSSVQITVEAMQANVSIPDCLFVPPAGPVQAAERQQESPKQTLEAFMSVDLKSMSTPEAIHWLARLDAAKKAVDPADPNAKSIVDALAQFHRLCVEKVRG